MWSPAQINHVANASGMGRALLPRMPCDRHTGAVQPAEEITCVDCGGRAFLFSHPPEDGWEVGDVVAYRCEDCRDRWDLVLEAEDLGLERE